jgi:mannose-6-phosphate isomerase-like protein (cupin superfamily)
MGYQVVDPEEGESIPDRPCLTRPITGDRAPESEGSDDGVTFDQLGIRLYEVAPGEQLPLQYHYHDIQEEGFHVLSGTLHVETPEKTYTVDEGDLFLAEPKSPHRAFNPESADGPVRVLAMGAPTSDGGNPYEP